MKIGFLSSLGAKCGISSYQEELSEGLIERNQDVKVACNYRDNDFSTGEILPEYAKSFFHVHFMDQERGLDANGVLDYLKDRDVVHVQLEPALYSPESLIDLVIRFRRELPHIKLIVTAHTNSCWPQWDSRYIHHYIAHQPESWCADTVIPLGVKFYPIKEVKKDYKSICSIGLGRNDDNLIKEAISGTDIKYTTLYGSNKWLPKEELINEIRKHSAVCLLYPQIDNDLASSAVITAMSAGVPVVVSLTSWFKHILNYSNIYPVENINDFRETVEYLTDVNNLERINQDVELMYQRLKEDKRTFNDFIDKHLEVYSNIIKNS